MKIKIRYANKKDVKFLWRLRNDNFSRRMSSNTKKIKYKNHTEWFKKHLNKSANKILLAYNQKNNEKIGYVRFDQNNLFNEVSINIYKKYKKKGLSYIVLSLAESFVKRNTILIAKVKKTNFISLRLFHSLNYHIIKEKNNFLTLAKIKTKNEKFSKHLKIIDQIENVRKKNNVNWMKLLRLAFEQSPKEASNIMSKIYSDDNSVGKFVKKLIK